MKDCFLAILAILGTVIGSGFISGKEIAVFFARFGLYSIPSIFLAFILFFFIFKLILIGGESAVKRMENNKFIFVLNLALCLIFAAAMFAGIANIVSKQAMFISIALFFIIIAICVSVFKRGMKSLNKLNMILVPLMIIFFLAVIFSKLNIKIDACQKSSFQVPSFIYAILYVVLNTANGSVLIARIGGKLNRSQKTQVAFFSALALFVILLIANLVLIFNPTSLNKAMPFLSLFSSVRLFFMTFVIFIGCLTTLLTLVYTMSFSMRGLCKNEFLIFFISIILPLLISLVGFEFVVEYLYPIGSVIGIYLLGDLFFIPLFKRAYQKIHSARKQT